ncbi:MAG: hypothetical protein WD825_04655 [Gemmatimonadaceae bacterium]
MPLTIRTAITAGFTTVMAACAPGRNRAEDTKSSASASDTLWLFAADAAGDAVRAADSEADLVKRYGAANVRRDSVLLGEGEFAAGVVLFPRDSTRRVEVAWKDRVNRAKPEFARVTGSRSRWIVYPGVSLGTCLEEVERINGEPFTFFGFAFDGSGTNHTWGKGRLDSLWGSEAGSKRVWIRFEPRPPSPPQITAAERRQLEGDKVLSSKNPIVRKVRPCVYELLLTPR